MNFISIQSAACAKTSKTDTNAQARCLEFIKARDKMIYESFDWKAAQIIVDKTISSASLPATSVNVPEIHHAISVRLDGKLLDPVSASYVFESATQTTDNYSTPGTPVSYDEQLDLSSGTRSIRFFPPLANDSQNHTLSILGKAPYNDAWTAPAIPATESALLAFVIGDMWEYLHAVGKAQAKFQEAALIVGEAQKQDTPALRSRSSRITTPTGNSLSEIADAVCDILDDFSPNTINSVKASIRRNHKNIWDIALWPISTVVASLSANNNIAIIPHLIDRIIAVRMNVVLATNQFKVLPYADSSLLLGIQPEIFNLTGQPLGYNLIMPVALPVSISAGSQLKLALTGTETAQISLKGEIGVAEAFETLKVTSADTLTAASYDTVLTISKPVTANSLNVKDTGGNILMTLRPGEQDRKYQRIQLFPQFDPTADQSLFVLGKRRIPQLMNDGDTCEITGAENILIAAATADILMRTKPDAAAPYQAQAVAQLTILIDKETKQQTYSPRILPYVEAYSSGSMPTKDNILG